MSITHGQSCATTMITWGPMANLLMKIMKNILRFVCVMLALSTLLVGCGQKPATDTKVDYQITVVAPDNLPLENIKVFVYEDQSLAELVCVATTDTDGNISFTEMQSEDFVAVLKEVPAGYDIEDIYSIETDQTVIQLDSRPLTKEEMQNLRYDVGDRLPDFEITDCTGATHSLYQLLETKKAVVLNFWFIGCQPCKLEFPYLQEAYEAYADQVAFLAMNPIDGTDDTVRAYQQEQQLTFPMANCDENWQFMLELTAYPTTLILDREGYIAVSHTGMFTDSSLLKNALAYFTQEDYQQSFFEAMEQIPAMG